MKIVTPSCTPPDTPVRRFRLPCAYRFGARASALTVLLLLCRLVPAAGQEFDTAFAARLQRTIETERVKWGKHGISAAVIVPGRGMWKGTDGESAPGIPIADTMLFGAGSITKTFTSALILQLAEEGKLSLGDPLHRWLPSYPNVDSTITIRRLLAHTSGVYNFSDNTAWGDSVMSNPARVWKPEELIGYFTKERSFDQGRGWEYSNTGYLLLGMIAEKATGSKLAAEFRKRFLVPLGLNSIVLEPDEEVRGELVHPWSDFTGDGEPEDIFTFPRQGIYSSAWAAGALVSTPADMASWGSALYGGRVLRDSSMARLLTFLSFTNGGAATGYGLGVFRHVVGGKTLYGHGGNVFGYSSSMLYYPEKGIVATVMVNGNMKADELGYVLMLEAIAGETAASTGYDAGSSLLSLGDIRIDRSAQAVIVEYSLAMPGSARITLHDILGREVAAISVAEREAGPGNAQIQLPNLPRGVYFCRIYSGNRAVTRKIVF